MCAQAKATNQEEEVNKGNDFSLNGKKLANCTCTRSVWAPRRRHCSNNMFWPFALPSCKQIKLEKTKEIMVKCRCRWYYQLQPLNCICGAHHCSEVKNTAKRKSKRTHKKTWKCEIIRKNTVIFMTLSMFPVSRNAIPSFCQQKKRAKKMKIYKRNGQTVTA